MSSGAAIGVVKLFFIKGFFFGSLDSNLFKIEWAKKKKNVYPSVL
jgi:hypothetical protein